MSIPSELEAQAAEAGLFEDLPLPSPEQVQQAQAKAAAQRGHDTPRLLEPNRRQIEMRASDLESLLAADHRAHGGDGGDGDHGTLQSPESGDHGEPHWTDEVGAFDLRRSRAAVPLFFAHRTTLRSRFQARACADYQRKRFRTHRILTMLAA